MRILSTGEKIRQLRLDLGLNQEDLTNDEITRSLISMIENNKRNLTYKTAKVLATTLNQYYQSLGKEITTDYLLESQAQQAERLIKERLDDLQKHLNNPAPGNEIIMEDSFQKLIAFAQEWELNDIIAQLIEARGKFYHTTFRYNEALKDYVTAQELYIKQEKFDKVAYVYNLLGATYYYMEMHEQALVYYEQSNTILNTHYPNNYDRLKKLVCFNKIICHRQLKKFELVLSEINYFKSLSNHEDEVLNQVSIMEGNTYRDLGNYDKALKIYNRLLKKITKLSSETQLLLYDNYANLLYTRGSYEKCLDYVQLAFQHTYKSSPAYIAKLMLLAAEASISLAYFDQAINYINKGILLAETVNDTKIAIQLHLRFIKINLENHEYLVAERSLKKLEEFTEENELKEQLNDIYSCLILLYSRVGEVDKCLDYSQKMVGLRQIFAIK